MEFRYKPGQERANADCLSRYPPLVSFMSPLGLNDFNSIKQAQAADAVNRAIIKGIEH